MHDAHGICAPLSAGFGTSTEHICTSVYTYEAIVDTRHISPVPIRCIVRGFFGRAPQPYISRAVKPANSKLCRLLWQEALQQLWEPLEDTASASGPLIQQ
jgi:hypothetical protein